jgi:hypothetical protein
MIKVIEKPQDVRVQYPAHYLLGNRYIDSIQGVVLTAALMEYIAKSEKVLFVYGLE